jgi:benzodiazapine receptor
VIKFSFAKAFAEITLLMGTIGACVVTFYPINKTAAYLMIPYFAWVSFATCLSFDIWRRNKGKKID